MMKYIYLSFLPEAVTTKKSCCLFFYMTYVYQLQIDKAKAYKGAKQAPTPPPRPPWWELQNTTGFYNTG